MDMHVVDVLNNSPSIILAVYAVIELIKALWRHNTDKSSIELDKDTRVTKIVFDMLEESKQGLANEREGLFKLTELLKRANFEISILERKVATLMSVIDRCVTENPAAHAKFELAMADFNLEIDNMRKIKNG